MNSFDLRIHIVMNILSTVFHYPHMLKSSRDFMAYNQEKVTFVVVHKEYCKIILKDIHGGGKKKVNLIIFSWVSFFSFNKTALYISTNNEIFFSWVSLKKMLMLWSIHYRSLYLRQNLFA